MERRRPSPALVVACVALFVALSGAGYAAISVPRGSVGAPQLKRNAVTTPKIRNAAVTAPKLRNGAVSSAKLADGTVGAIDIAPGVVPPALLSRAGSVPSGLTIRGTFMSRPDNGSDGAGYSFGVQLASAPIVHYVGNASPPPAECPGTVANPDAIPGHLCVYEGLISTNVTVKCVLATTSNVCGTATRWGFGFTATGTVAGTYVWGTWAVTSP